MVRAEIIATIALIVALCSLGFSIYLGIRDRGKLQAVSKFFPGSEYGSPHIRISIVNAGRRPIVLRMLVAVCDDDYWFGSYLGDHKSGLRLGEHEHHEITWEKDEFLGGPEDDKIAGDLQVEDSLGRRHAVQDAKENIRRLLEE